MKYVGISNIFDISNIGFNYIFSGNHGSSIINSISNGEYVFKAGRNVDAIRLLIYEKYRNR